MAEVLWTLVRRTDELEARTLPTALGTELRIFCNGDLEWSRTFAGETDTAAIAVAEAAADKCQEFLAKGWTPR